MGMKLVGDATGCGQLSLQADGGAFWILDVSLMNWRFLADSDCNNNQLESRQFTSKPYSTKSTASRASFTILSAYAEKAIQRVS
jgi:hypothetical protein